MGLRLIKLHPIKSAAGMIPIYAGWARGSLLALEDYRLINKGIAIFINGQRQCIR